MAESKKSKGARSDKFTWKPGDVKVYKSLEDLKKAKKGKKK